MAKVTKKIGLTDEALTRGRRSSERRGRLPSSPRSDTRFSLRRSTEEYPSGDGHKTLPRVRQLECTGGR